MTHSEPVLKFAAPHDDLLEIVDKIDVDSSGAYIDEISKIIRRYLRFQKLEHLGRQRGFSPGNIAETKSTSCFGLSIITSEILSLKGISNAILWANLHALVAASDEDGDAWLLHTDLTQLNSTVPPQMAMIINPMARQPLSEWLAGDEQQTPLMLDTQEILSRKGHKLSSKKKEELEWLSFLDPNRSIKSYTERRMRQGNLLMATLTRDQLGRQMLENMANFTLAVLRGQDDLASENLLNMAGVWPEIDRRNLRDNSYGLNQYLARRGFAGDETFLDQVNVVADSATKFSSDLGVHLWRPDMLRRVAVKTADKNIMDLAISGYEKIYAWRRSELVRGKLAKASQQAKRLAKKS
jgi:hypothetical protein